MTRHLALTRNLSKNFNGLIALKSVSIDFESGRITTIAGPNGAGKTTFFNIVCGLEHADSGEIYFENTEISKIPPPKRAKMGISRTFQTTQVFDALNVVENIMIGRYLKTKVPFILAGLWLPMIYRQEHLNMTKAYEILEFLGMYEKADRKISQLSYQERKLVEIGRCLATKPKLLLLDEPFGGLNIMEIDLMSEKLMDLRNQGIAIAVIDHHFGSLTDISDQIDVLNHGEVIAKGTPEKIKNDEDVVRTYLVSKL